MPDFEKMVKAARTKSEGLIQAAAEAERAKKDADERRIAEADKFLQENVLPVLMQASTAFAAHGIDSEIDAVKSWRSSTHATDPVEIRAVNFHCEGKLDGAESGDKTIRGEKFVIEHDGTVLSWKTYMASTAGQRFAGGTVEDFVAPIVNKALDSYYEKLRSARL